MASIDSEIKSKFASEQHRLMTNIVFTANWVQHAFNEDLKPFGISQQQYNMLRILRGLGGWRTMSEIKDGLLDKSPNATRLADKLLKKKLIDRKSSKTDRRRVYIRISKIGLKLFEAINQTESPVQQAITHNISEEEAKLASDILDKLRT